MSDVVIHAEGLGKKYLIGHQAERERYIALRDAMSRAAKKFVRSAHDMLHGRQLVEGDEFEEFWALKDVDFQIKRGDVVGIIGRNGAGKSTLLKVLSRITEPSAGRVVIKGRMASLLEVGTGFHPELSGRENIYLNGAILGMSRKEIRRKFDEIVAFSDVEKFLDTPVKHYSSGMYVRLAFAVAAHLEPEILVVDEVLAVGDAEFQKRCLSKMDEVAAGGRTVLFVSHEMRRVTSLCDRVILLAGGRVEAEGDASMIIDRYLMKNVITGASADLVSRGDHSGNGEAVFESIALLKDGRPGQTFSFREEITFRVAVRVNKPIPAAILQVAIVSSEGFAVHELVSAAESCKWRSDITGVHIFDIRVAQLLIYPGTYSVNLWIGDSGMRRCDYLIEAIKFSVIQTPESGLTWSLDRSNGTVFQAAIWDWTGPRA